MLGEPRGRRPCPRHKVDHGVSAIIRSPVKPVDKARAIPGSLVAHTDKGQTPMTITNTDDLHSGDEDAANGVTIIVKSGRAAAVSKGTPPRGEPSTAPRNSSQEKRSGVLSAPSAPGRIAGKSRSLK